MSEFKDDKLITSLCERIIDLTTRNIMEKKENYKLIGEIRELNEKYNALQCSYAELKRQKNGKK